MTKFDKSRKYSLWVFGMLLFSMFSYQHLWAQCGSGTFSITSQIDIDDFATNYPSCTQLSGSLSITGTDITDLSGLSQITSVGGLLSVHSTNVSNLGGLDNVTLISGNVEIRSNSMLTSIAGLNSLTSIAGNLQIHFNPALLTISGFANLADINGELEVRSNGDLMTITGLGSLATLGTDLHIHTNADLTSISGLVSLTGTGAVPSAALQLNGNLSHLRNAVTATTTTNTFTMESWVKPATDANWQRVYGSQGFGDFRIQITEPGSPQFLISFNSFSSNVLQSAVLPSLNQWYHVAFTGDGTTIRLYVDGEVGGNHKKTNS